MVNKVMDTTDETKGSQAVMVSYMLAGRYCTEDNALKVWRSLVSAEREHIMRMYELYISLKERVS